MHRPTQKRLFVRADVTPEIGAGHVMRCLSLAQVCSDRGWRVIFAGKIPNELIDRLSAHGFCVNDSINGDIGASIAAIADGARSGDWVMLDGYHFGTAHQHSVRASGFRLLMMDDLIECPQYSADIVLNMSIKASPLHYKAGPEVVILCGPYYRLLRKEFLTQSITSIRGHSSGSKVLVSFGGADSNNATRAAILGLEAALRPRDWVRIVLGPVNNHRKSINKALSSVGYHYEIIENATDMSPLMAWADLAISAAGGTAWEMAAVGLPAILIPIAANQEPGAESLFQAGAMVRLKDPQDLDGPEFPGLVRDLLGDAERREHMSKAGRALVDGQGGQRVAHIMEVLSGEIYSADFVLRRAEWRDAEQIFRIAAAPDVRVNALSSQPFTLETHLPWYQTKLLSAEAALFVLELAGLVVAVARYDRVENGQAEIDYVVHKAFREKGLGRLLLTQSFHSACESLSLDCARGVVLEHNIASIRSFQGAEFTNKGATVVQGKNCIIFERRR